MFCVCVCVRACVCVMQHVNFQCVSADTCTVKKKSEGSVCRFVDEQMRILTG